MENDVRLLQMTAVVVNYNGGDDLLACVESLVGDPGIGEVIVVDNASDDGSADAIRRMSTDTTVVLSPENLGFGGGANLGATHASGDLLVFLNPDTVPDPDCMTLLAHHLFIHDGVVGPAVRNGTGGPVEFGCTVDRMLLLRALDHPGRPLYISGCCLATTRSCFDAIGGFDARYFLFQEDVEFCWQALRRGFIVEALPGASLIHAGGAVTAGGYRRAGRIETSSMRILLRERNSWALLLACVPARHLLYVLATSIVRTIAFTGIMVKHRRLGGAVRLWIGVAWNVRHVRTTLERRRRPGVDPSAAVQAWDRVARPFFLWDLIRRGERLRFVDGERAEVGR